MNTSQPEASARRWLAHFWAAFFAPALAIVLKPDGYRFYMFYPTTPPGLAERLQLSAANSLLAVAAIVCAVAALRLSLYALPLRRWRYLALPLLAFVHPLLQPVFFESLDNKANIRLADRARSAAIVGWKPEQVRALFGVPDSDYPYGRDGAETRWTYHPLRFYWLGSKLEIFFRDGVVSSFDGNDD